MKLTCTQMDILLSFYIENELSDSLKLQVEEHLRKCPKCANNYAIIKSMAQEIKNSITPSVQTPVNRYHFTNITTNNNSYGNFKTNMSAYIDNELSADDGIKIKKFSINNSKAKKDLEESYKIRRLMKESLKKTKADAKKDFSKKIIKKIESDDDIMLNFHPAIKFLIIFTVSILIATTAVITYFM
ncbi:MAG: zf-HC2 domain-containing protein [bacterium]|nr:zf-HC2 domain-containing protein [bacterium]